MRRGVAVLIAVILVAVAGLYVLASWQSRLLLGIQRSQSVSDSLRVLYAAESEVYDWVARFLGEYPQMFDPPLGATPRALRSGTLPDGTNLSVEGKAVDGTETLLVTARRQFSTTNIELSRTVSEEMDTIVTDTDLLFSLDCSASMGDPACDGCTETRMEKLKQALIAFIDSLAGKLGSEKVRMGLSVFSMKAEWLYTGYDGSGNPSPGSRPVSPRENVSLATIKQAVNAAFSSGGGESGTNGGGRFVTASPACKKVLSETNIGGGLTFMHDYYASDASGRKQIEILVTDGEPNQRTPYPDCPTSIFCPWDVGYCPGGAKRSSLGESWSCPSGSGSACMGYARDYLRCALATTDDRWMPEEARSGGSVAGYSTTRLLAFEGEPTPTTRPTRTPTPTRNPLTPTPTRRPTRTPTPTRNPLTPSPTRRPTGTPRPTRTPTPGPSSRQGVRDPGVDLYTVAVMEEPPVEVVNMFNDFSTKHYSSETANDLTSILGQIFQEILNRSVRFDVRRVIPSPIR